MARQKVYGPYHVRDIGVGEHVYEVVRMVDKEKPTICLELIPRRTYLKRQSAYAMCVRLNRRWQISQEDCIEALNYWNTEKKEG